MDNMEYLQLIEIVILVQFHRQLTSIDKILRETEHSLHHRADQRIIHWRRKRRLLFPAVSTD